MKDFVLVEALAECESKKHKILTGFNIGQKNRQKLGQVKSCLSGM
jgi:hypothetical protein